MSTSQQREPTNDQLWAQPPADAPSVQHGQVVAPYTAPSSAPLPAVHPHAQADKTQFVLGIVSLGIGVPLSGIGGGIGGLAGLLIVWVGIVLVNFVYGWTRRPH